MFSYIVLYSTGTNLQCNLQKKTKLHRVQQDCQNYIQPRLDRRFLPVSEGRTHIYMENVVIFTKITIITLNDD